MKRGIIIGVRMMAIAAVIILAFFAVSKGPVALIRVVDSAGQPVPGAVIKPDGLRPKPGPYASGHYRWPEYDDISKGPILTDKFGVARVPYPKYVFERIETGQISFAIDHPDFIPDRPFRVVNMLPPRGAPWRDWAGYLWARIRYRERVTQTEPVVLKLGAALRISVAADSAGPADTPLFAQVSGHWIGESGFWTSPEPGVLVTHRLPPGKQAVRALRFDHDGAAWFSEVIDVTATMEQTNEMTVHLTRGASVQGRLDLPATRPIGLGRVVAHVWPTGYKPQDSPPQWHAWTLVTEDRTFYFDALPPGDLEVVALCDGFVSTNGPGTSGIRHPQKHTLATNDLDITVGMEPTARLEVRVSDERGAPIAGARVMTWPNVHYGDWGATILMSDCYNMVDVFQAKPGAQPKFWGQSVPDFQGTSDSTGLAVLPNLPSDVTEFAVEHQEFALPAVNTPGGDKRRQSSIKLVVGRTNQVSVTLVPRDRSPIRHY